LLILTYSSREGMSTATTSASTPTLTKKMVADM